MKTRPVRFTRRVLYVAIIAVICLGTLPEPGQASEIAPSIELTGPFFNAHCDMTGGPYAWHVPAHFNVYPLTSYYATLTIDGLGEIWNEGPSMVMTMDADGAIAMPPSPGFSVPYGTHFTVSVTTYYGQAQTGGISYESVLVYACGSNTLVSLTNTDDPPVESGDLAPESVPVAGPDMVYIPETAVVGTFTANTALYFDANAECASAHQMSEGQTLWVLGINEAGTFYQVLLSGQTYWVPVNNIGPNYDNVWHGTPLPTVIVD